jgi:hypothetical protein
LPVDEDEWNCAFPTAFLKDRTVTRALRNPGVSALAKVDCSFKQRHPAHAVLLGEKIRGGEAMPSSADDHYIVRALQREGTPGRIPAAVAANPATQHVQKGIALHT